MEALATTADATSPDTLDGQCVALTGRLASMTHAEATECLTQQGATVSRYVTHGTTLVVVGAGTYPVNRRGRLSRSLETARSLQAAGHPVVIISEDELLRRLHGDRASTVCQWYSPLELTRILDVTPDRLLNWVRCGLLVPSEWRGVTPYFDFRQVSRARHLLELVTVGVSSAAIRRTLMQLRRWSPGVDEALASLSHLKQDGGRLYFERSDGALLEPTGQQLFRFDEVPDHETIPFARESSPDALFAAAVQHEEQGEYSDAVQAYYRLLDAQGPDPVVCFNLANALYATGQMEAAAQRYRQVVELDPQYVEAWTNLGNVYAEQGEYPLAVEALRRAVDIGPQYADARYALADALTEIGAVDEARPHWEAYLRAEPGGEWADHARSQLRECSA
jgi:predicted TPR repeat methyltransferase/DNA-binding transcriptional MerR regulator